MTTPAKTVRVPFSAVLLYWLLLVGGLAVLTALRIDHLEKVAPIWVGGVLGTAFGQTLGWLRVRLWLGAFLVGNLMWIGPLMTWPIWAALGPWVAVEDTLLAFGPAALCGYLSLSERGALPAFWFPAMVWALSILDSAAGSDIGGAGSWLLLSGLAALFVAFLRAKETRRVALWQNHAPQPLAMPGRSAVMREAPLRVVGQAGWIAAVGAATLLLTAWIAPHLWQKENTTSRSASAPAAGVGMGAGPGAMACCPQDMPAEVKRERVREYLPLMRAHDTEIATTPQYCTACRDGVPIGSGRAGAVASAPHGERRGIDDTPYAADDASPPFSWTPHDTKPAAKAAPHVGLRPEAPPPPAVTAARPRPVTPPPVAATPKPPSVAAAPPAPATAAPVAVAPVPAAGAAPVVTPAPMPALVGVRPPPPAVVPAAVTSRTHVWPWLLATALTMLAIEILHRPLRRRLTLRHLTSPMWPETVDQRVSNLWQLVLVGLRDAGFRTIPGEQPQEMAKRIGIEGLAACATVLDRARHGVRVDAGDLQTMERAARSVYEAARRRAGWAARAAAWLRWPLV